MSESTRLNQAESVRELVNVARIYKYLHIDMYLDSRYMALQLLISTSSHDAEIPGSIPIFDVLSALTHEFHFI